MTGSLEALLIWAPILSVFGLAVAGGLYLYILRQPAGTGALQETIAPSLTAVSVPPIIGLLLGKAALGGMLVGATLSGILFALWSRLQARTSPSETRRRTRHDSSTLPPARLDFVARL